MSKGIITFISSVGRLLSTLVDIKLLQNDFPYKCNGYYYSIDSTHVGVYILSD